jgi:hypothetical protein
MKDRLPKQLVEIQHLEDTKPRSPKLKELRPLLARVQELRETNPMLGLRGCRLGIAFPEITEMQSRAIIEAAVAVKNKGGNPHVEIMIPLIGTIEEMRNQTAIVRRASSPRGEADRPRPHHQLARHSPAQIQGRSLLAAPLPRLKAIAVYSGWYPAMEWARLSVHQTHSSQTATPNDFHP